MAGLTWSGQANLTLSLYSVPEYSHNQGLLTDHPDPLEEMPWMMVAYQDVMPAIYILLRDWSDWEREYRSPPKVVRS
jgi:hypothetical protein